MMVMMMMMMIMIMIAALVRLIRGGPLPTEFHKRNKNRA